VAENPEEMANALGIDKETLKNMTPEELIPIFSGSSERTERGHHGGNKWIGTGGTSPTGHSGIHPGGMRRRRGVEEPFGRQGRHGRDVTGLLRRKAL